jgi:hypothetical protein
MQRQKSGKRAYDHGSVRICGGAAWSVPSARICFAFELVNEGCCLTQPFEPLLRSEPVKLSVAVEVLGRALSQRTLEFFAR